MTLGTRVWHRFVTWIVGALLVLCAGSLGVAQGKVRVSGKIVDEDGKAVNGVTVRFTLESDESETRSVAVKKKGRFTDSGLEPGSYRVDLVEPDLYVSLLEFDVRNAADLRVGSGKIEGHPRTGVSGLPIKGGNEVRLTLTVATKASLEAGDREMTIAAPELSAAAKHYNRGEFEQASTQAERVLAANPDLAPEANYIRGVALEKLGRLEQAEPVLRQAAEAMPDYPRIWAALSEVTLTLAAGHEERGETAAAREAFGRAVDSLTRAIERDPETLALRVNLAASLDRTGDNERLVQVLEGIVELDPTHLQSKLRLAGLYSSRGEHDRAVALLDEIPTTEKRVAVTIYNIAVGLNEDGDIDGSLLLAQRAAEIDPQLPQARRLVAQILLGKNDPPAAIEAIRIFLEVAPDDPEAEVYRRILAQLEGQ